MFFLKYKIKKLNKKYFFATLNGVHYWDIYGL